MADIPTKGAKLKRDTVIKPHDDYEARRLEYRLHRHCYEGSGGFYPKLKRIYKSQDEMSARDYLRTVEQDETVETYLVPHAREHAEDFKDRMEQAHIINIIKHRGIKPLTGFLCANDPDRQNHPPEFEEWLKNATVDGYDFDSWKAKTGIPYGLVYSHLPCIIDADPHAAASEQERIDENADTAKLRVVHPDNILDWVLGKGGRLEAIKYKAQVDMGNLVDGHEMVDRYCYVLPGGWFWVDDDDKATELTIGGSGVWPWVGGDLPQRAPIVNLQFEPLLYDIAPVWKRLFNKISEGDELERKQVPVFFAPEDEGGDDNQPGQVKATGANVFFGVPQGSNPPGFASPDPGCLNHYMESEDRYYNYILEVLGTASIFGATAEAAATLAYKFDVTEKKLVDMAKCTSRFETDCAEVVMLWNGKALDRDKFSTEHNHGFNAVAVERLLEQIARLKQEIGPFPPTADMIMEKKAFFAVFPDVDEEDQENLDKEWELQVEEAAHADETDPGDMGDPETVPTPGGNVAGDVGSG